MQPERTSDAQDLRLLLDRIVELHEGTGPAVLQSILRQPNDAAAAAAAREVILGLRDRFLDGVQSGSAIVDPAPRSYSADEYVIPRELRDVHPEIVAHLLSDKMNRSAPYVGLLLHGIAGTGKSEYPLFLAGINQDKIEVVIVSVSSIRNAASPGDALKQLYQRLDERARTSGRYVVAVFDEFDQMITRGGAQYRSQRTEERAQHSERRSHTEMIKHTSEMLEVDEKGEEVLAAFKSVLGSTGGVDRVFTVATSNLRDFPQPIYREGRLHRIELKGFDLQLLRGKAIPVYASFGERIAEILDVLSATHHREHGRGSEALRQLRAEWDALALGFSMVVRGTAGDENVLIFGAATPQLQNANAEVLNSVLKLFGGPKIQDLSNDAKRSFAGLFERDGSQLGPPLFGRFVDLPLMSALTASRVAGLYLELGANFESVDAAKAFLRELLFPQTLPGWRAPLKSE